MPLPITPSFARLLAFCLPFSSLVVLPSAYSAPSKAAARREATAREFVERLRAGEFEAATRDFDEAMLKALPPKALRAVWEGLEAQYGKFQSCGKSTKGRVGSYPVIYIKTKFENGTRRLKIVFDRKNRIAGFFHEPTGRPAEYKPPTYDRADQYTEENVKFGAAPWEIEGKLTLPLRDGPMPAVVLVHGSGPHDEDETIGPNKPFRDLATGLSSRGIAVLRYQKRTYAHKLLLLTQKTITVRQEVIDDALSALAFARTHKAIDPSRVYLLGHSLGATLAPHIAKDEGHLAGVILLAGTPRDFGDVLESQLSYIASLPGPGQDQNRKLYDEARKLIVQMKDGKAKPDALLLGAPVSYWTEVSDYAKRSLQIAKILTCPMFIAGGGRDYQVTHDDFIIYHKALDRGNRVAFHWYDDLNHLFMTGKGKATPAEYGLAGHVEQRVIDDLAKWIDSHASPRTNPRAR